jgi:uncharacterized phiE125 gp8 family phage protein
MAELKLAEGWTAPIEETLKSNGAPVDLTGQIVTLILQTASGGLVDVTGNVTVPTPTTGVVRYSPDPTDLLAVETPHVARWKVTDSGGRVAYFPNEEGEVWTVLPTTAATVQDNALLTVQELKQDLNLSNNTADLLLARFINACSDALETKTGRRLKSRAYVNEYVYVYADRVLGFEWLEVESPITALDMLEVDGVLQNIWIPGDPGSPEDADVFVLETSDPKSGRDRIYRYDGWPDGALVQRTYTAGYGVAGFPIPGDLKQAVTFLARDWFYGRDRQMQNIQSRSGPEGGAVAYINEALPRQFVDLIRDYRRWR